jgi:hypothetical protein
MERTLEGLIEEVRRLPVAEQLTLIERLVRSIHADVEKESVFREELTAWDGLSDEALANFEKGSWSCSAVTSTGSSSRSVPPASSPAGGRRSSPRPIQSHHARPCLSSLYCSRHFGTIRPRNE